MILLVADLQELKANPKRDAIGTIVEAKLDKGRGPVATALVQTGTLKVGDIIVVGETFGRVRALENDQGKRVTKAGPVDRRRHPRPVRRARGRRHPARRRATRRKPARMVETRKAAAAAKGGEGSGRATLEDLYSQIQAGQAKELRIILKADVSGSLGAITHALEQLDQDEVRLNVLLEGAGDITDNDIMLAAASNAIVVGFNTKITDTARRAAEAEGVDVRLYDIIYKLTDDIEAALKGLLEPEIVEVVEGRAEVRQIIRVGKNTVIAGSFVTDGRIVRGGTPGSGAAARSSRPTGSSRCAASATTSARCQQNYECGIGLANFHDIVEGDIIECFTLADGQPGLGQLMPRSRRASDEPANRRIDELLRAGDRRRSSRARSRIRGSGSRRSPTVETTPDLRHAKVWVSVIGQPAERDAAIAALRHADAVRPARARQARCASGGSRTCTSTSTTPPSAGRGSSSCSPSSRPARRPTPTSPVAESLPTPGRPRPPGRRPRRGAAVRGPAVDPPRPREAARPAAADDPGKAPHRTSR